MGTGTGNPLEGDSVLAGYSYGWRRALARLPRAPDVRIRFDMGTGTGNSGESAHGYAGWAIDDVRVLEGRPRDEHPPSLVALPPAVVGVVHGRKPSIRLEVAGNIGVEAVRVEYSWLTADDDLTYGQQRLAMDPAGLTVFHDSLRLIPEWGDKIRYRLSALDFDGNESVAPPAPGQSYKIRVNLYQSSVLSHAAVTGLWEAISTGGFAATGTATDPISSIMMGPREVVGSPFVNVTLQLVHAYQFDNSSGSNLKVSLDAGASWSVIAPQAGYGGTFSGGAGHAMNGQPTFAGTDSTDSTFDLSQYAHQQVQFRLDWA